jgi:biotin carboxyl carrier protein
MKLEIKVRDNFETHEIPLEIERLPAKQADRGTLRFDLAGEVGEIDWSEVLPGTYSILLGGRSYEAHVATQSGEPPPREAPYVVQVGSQRYLVEVCDPRRRRQGGSAHDPGGPQEILAPMPGKVVKVLVAETQEVASGEGLLVIEAMKMQNEIRASRAGRVEKLYVREGTGVETGVRLLRLA